MVTEDKGSMSSNSNLDAPQGKRHREVEHRLRLFRHIGGTIAIVVSIATLVVGGIEFYIQQQNNINMASTQHLNDQLKALDERQQATLTTYFDRMQDLLLAKPDDFKAYKKGDQYQALAAARTFTALQDLDGRRKASLIRFLWEAGLIYEPNPIIRVPGADLSGADFAPANLPLNLPLNLYMVSLMYAILDRANLSNVDLSGADLRGAIMYDANLYDANLGCIYNGPCANLAGADLRYANLRGTNLAGANLSDANLNDADLRYANLAGDNLSSTPLFGAKYTTKSILANDAHGNPITLRQTLWPQGFDPKAAGAICVDC